MINANTLMIGNYVQYNPVYIDEGTELNPLPVILINAEDGEIKLADGFENYYGEVELDPIRITPEILEKAGFVKEEEFNTWYLGYFQMVLNDEGFFYNCYIPHHLEIKYIHQLQNLYFALTGTELQIEL